MNASAKWHKMLAMLVSGTVWLGAMNASSAQSPSGPQSKTVPSVSAVGSGKADRNSAPLPPGGAAGIKQAQGRGETIWNIVGIGLIAGVAIWMIADHGGDGSDDSPAPTTSN